MNVVRSFDWHVTSENHPGARDAYRDSFAGLHEIDQLKLGPGGLFFNHTRMTMFNSGVIGHGRSNTQILRRPAPQVRRAGYDALSLVLANSPMTGRAGERSYSCAPGSIISVDLSRPSESHWTDLDLVNLVIPRELVPAGLANADLHGIALSPDSAMARLIGNHMRSLSEVACHLSEEQGRAAIEAAVMLVEIGLGGQPTVGPDHRAALYRTVRERASRYLEPRLRDPGLTADRIARACAVSRATLYRAFEKEAGLMRYVQRRRLELSREALARRAPGASVADIAHDHGFASPAHFSRAFRDQFGFSPSDVPPLDRRSGAPRRSRGIALGEVVDWLRRSAAEA